MGANAELDFGSLLDQLIAAADEVESDEGLATLSPSLRVDMLDQIERLQAENIELFRDRAAQEYGENAGSGEAPPVKPATATPAHLQPALEDLFFLDPESISRELGIKPKSKPDELDRARRAFAMRYHPDRMPEELRDRAALRMQIANMLIDEAKRGKR
ncbi:hypothetical protein FY036_16880 [Mesorhizobium microcysteis]|uniref:J domain-containing protein n=1 Tax=Neoaquamicrobium microcysteis TaxID=2682781 RepID=A0A5D4GQL0_9HYPH|nr:hypothetical protein [Mesorhizobium microcysteis]TYR31101.1 hypothetical protein FY036_16880 [Mesorhizobium microcysteis]